MKRVIAGLLAVVLLVALVASGCSNQKTTEYVSPVHVEIQDESVALASTPTVLSGTYPVASGIKTKSGKDTVIDYSNASAGYIMVKYQKNTNVKLKVQLTGPSGATYTYNLKPAVWTSFPLSDGNGSYKISVFQNVTGTKYSALLSMTQIFNMTDEFAPFLTSNQYVDYASAPNTVAKAKELMCGVTDPLKKVEKVYNFVVNGLTYDKEKAKTVQSGYLPVLDTVLSTKKGICFDYAALMAGMLRSQGVPCKLVVGYAGTAYHAWISVYTKEYGWINGAIYFDGTTWQRMDPTFASSGKQSKTIMAYIGDGKNYQSKYFY